MSEPSSAVMITEDAVIDLLAEQAARRYRLGPAAVRHFIEGHVAHVLAEHDLSRYRSFKQLQQAAWFKRLRSEAKKRLYYDLRQYKDPEAFQSAMGRLVQVGADDPAGREAAARAVRDAHRSSAERLEDEARFYEEMCVSGERFGSILDVGCGVHPLGFPWAACQPELKRYVALERDDACLDAMHAFRRHPDAGALEPIKWSIEKGWDVVREQTGIETYDAAFLLKLVPVICQQHPEWIPFLEATPARVWMVSGSRTALAKRTSIERRDRATVERFLAEAGKQIRFEIVLEHEFVYGAV